MGLCGVFLLCGASSVRAISQQEEADLTKAGPLPNLDYRAGHQGHEKGSATRSSYVLQAGPTQAPSATVAPQHQHLAPWGRDDKDTGLNDAQQKLKLLSGSVVTDRLAMTHAPTVTSQPSTAAASKLFLSTAAAAAADPANTHADTAIALKAAAAPYSTISRAHSHRSLGQHGKVSRMAMERSNRLSVDQPVPRGTTASNCSLSSMTSTLLWPVDAHDYVWTLMSPATSCKHHAATRSDLEVACGDDPTATTTGAAEYTSVASSGLQRTLLSAMFAPDGTPLALLTTQSSAQTAQQDTSSHQLLQQQPLMSTTSNADSGALLRSAAVLLRKPQQSTAGASPSVRISEDSPSLASSFATPLRPEDGLMSNPLELLSGLGGMRFLASGAFASVYAAMWQGLQVAAKLVACKQLGRSSPVLREALLGRTLQHPNIVTSYLTRVALFKKPTLTAAMAMGAPAAPPHLPLRASSSAPEYPAGAYYGAAAAAASNGGLLRSSSPVLSQEEAVCSPSLEQRHVHHGGAGGVAAAAGGRALHSAAPAACPSRRAAGPECAGTLASPRAAAASAAATTAVAASAGAAASGTLVASSCLKKALASSPSSGPQPCAPSTNATDVAAGPAGLPPGSGSAAAPGISLKELLRALSVDPDTYVCLCVMEFCSLGSLQGLCTRDVFGPFSRLPGPLAAERLLVKVAKDVAQGLAYLHSNGLIHGDVKPANVLLQSVDHPHPHYEQAAFAAAAGLAPPHATPERADTGQARPLASPAAGGVGVAAGTRSTHQSTSSSGSCMRGGGSGAGATNFIAKLSDFGMSQIMTQAGGSAAEGQVGTVPYAAPERFEGNVSAAVDIYSFGILLWQMASGCRPYADLKIGHIILGVCCGDLRPKWPEDRHPLLEPLYSKCVRAQASERPTAEQIVAELTSLERQLRARAREGGMSKAMPPPIVT